MFALLMQVILYLSPPLQLSSITVKQYADLISFESRWYGIDPLLISSIIEVESGWNTRKRSKTNDYGLMQIHVAKRGSARFYRREKELYNPRVNIREGARILDMWRVYHNQWCRSKHPYWAHFKWGKYVKDTKHAEKVRKLYAELHARFQYFSPKKHPSEIIVGIR